MGRCGYRVYAGMRSIHDRNADAARELSDWAVAQNAAIDILELDVDSEESVNGAVGAIRDAGGEIDVVVNNAAITAWGPTEAFDFEQLASVYNTNVFGPWRVNKAVLPQMRARRSGLIIHVTSVVGRVLRTGALYAASKWAAEGLAESMAHEVRRFGIDVVLLEPGAYPTPWVGRGITPADKQIVAETTRRRQLPLRSRSNPALTIAIRILRKSLTKSAGSWSFPAASGRCAPLWVTSLPRVWPSTTKPMRKCAVN